MRHPDLTSPTLLHHRRPMLPRLVASAISALMLVFAMPAKAQIDPYRPIAQGTVGIYQDAGASWGWERVGSWGWERVGSWGWERVGSWGWERVARSASQATLVGLVFVEQSALGATTQHWAYFDNYAPGEPSQLMSTGYDYPDLSAYLGDMATLARAYVPVPAGNGACDPEPTCVTLVRGSSDVADALIKQGESERNYGASQSLTVSGGSTGERRALLRFDTSAIPPGAMVQSAELSLSGLIGGTSAAVTAVMAPWDEASVTWRSFEASGAPFGVASGGPHLFRASATVPLTAPGARSTTSLGGLVQTWVDHVIPNYGIVLDKQATEALGVFASSESPGLAQRPQLTVCYRACETRCPESCGDGTVCAAGRCRAAEEPWAEAVEVCLNGPLESDPCGSHGVYANGRCFCDPGFSGSACEQAEGCPAGCNDHGLCHFGQCFCEPGFSGATCDRAEGCPSDCSGNGICHFGQCFCDPGYSGPDCAPERVP